jgi:hypothetical protein
MGGMTSFETSTPLRAARHLTLPQPSPASDRARDAVPSPAQVVQAAARAIDRDTLRPVSVPSAGVAYHPRSLLALLVYCYVSGTYASEDIESLMRRDASFRKLCGEEFPDAHTLRRFRRHNRETIENCMQAVLRALAEQQGERVSDADVKERAGTLVTTAILMDLE